MRISTQTPARKQRFSAKRLALDGVLVAVFFALSLFSVEVGGVKLTFDALPVVIAAMLFGPFDAFLVAFFGALLEQMLHFGFTATTILWILPPACRGLLIGLGAKLFHNAMSLDAIFQHKRPFVYLAVCIAAGLITSTLNTLAYYVDAKLYGYYNFALIFGVYGVRLLTGAITAVITALVAVPVLLGLYKANLTRSNPTSCQVSH